MKQNSQEILNPNRFISRIKTSDEFLDNLPRTSVQELPREKRQGTLHRAIAASALSLAEREKREGPGHDLDASLFQLVSGLQDFYQGSRTLDHLRDKYGSPRNMPPHEKDIFYDSKDSIINFNHSLVEVINSGASQFNFDALLTFMTNMFSASNDHHVGDFHTRAREAIIGMRNEMAVEQLLITGGVEFRRGTPAEDEKGGDFFIDDVPIDFKSSKLTAENARRKAEERGYDGSTILWSHVEFEDFKGELMLPYDKCVEIFAKLKPELDAVIAAHKQPLVAHAI